MEIYLPTQGQSNQDLLNAFDQILNSTGGVVHAATPFTLDQKGIDKENRSASGTAWVEEISRRGYFFKAKGIDFTNYLKTNPVVLACHQQATAELIPGAIAMVSDMAVSGKKLKFSGMVFDVDPLSEAWWQKVSTGFVRMVSIGPMPISWDVAEVVIGKGKDEKVIRFIEVTESELVELTVCPVGANRPALFDRVSFKGRNQALEAKMLELEARLDSFLAIDGDADQDFGNASWPDAAFVIERGAPTEDGQTVHEYRHLPHHRPSARSVSDNSSVDLAQLCSALAKVNQVRTSVEPVEAYRSRAMNHLQAHARELLKIQQKQMGALEEVLFAADGSSAGRLMSAIGDLSGV